MGYTMSKARRYSVEFKREAVELLRRSGKTATDVAKDLGIPYQNLSRWKEQADKRNAKAKATPRSASALEVENAELRRQLERVGMERDFLKKAAAFFAKDEK
ncbi:MAG: transposase [bacterium]|nr:transposase [bacterium]